MAMACLSVRNRLSSDRLCVVQDSWWPPVSQNKCLRIGWLNVSVCKVPSERYVVYIYTVWWPVQRSRGQGTVGTTQHGAVCYGAAEVTDRAAAVAEVTDERLEQQRSLIERLE